MKGNDPVKDSYDANENDKKTAIEEDVDFVQGKGSSLGLQNKVTGRVMCD